MAEQMGQAMQNGGYPGDSHNFLSLIEFYLPTHPCMHANVYFVNRPNFPPTLARPPSRVLPAPRISSQLQEWQRHHPSGEIY